MDEQERVMKVGEEAVDRGKNLVADGIERYSDVAACWIAGAISSTAKEAARYLRTHDPGTMLREARTVVRRKPWLVASVGIVGGLVATRLCRAAVRGEIPPPETS